MRRTDPVYKPAMLLVVLDLLDEGLATPRFIPLKVVVQRFDALLVRAGVVRDSGRAFMPAYHLSASSKTDEPFWSLVKGGQDLARQDQPSTNSRLLATADGFRLDDVLADELGGLDVEQAAVEVARASIYQLLESDGRPDCLALLADHDRDADLVDEAFRLLVSQEGGAFILDDHNARRVRTVREQLNRDRSLRRAVLPTYDFACALCSTRIIWNNLSEVEVAHIKPRSLRGVDDPRNALSLCQTHHWAFDMGLWSADDELLVLVGAPLEPRGDDLAALRRYEGQRLRAPDRVTARPHPQALRWHREHRFGQAA